MFTGDSQIRFIDKAFCLNDRSRRQRVCFSRAGTEDIVSRLDITADNRIDPIICISA